VTILNGDLLLSARTTKGHGHAAELLSRALHGIGHCGGHAHRAGGRILVTDCGLPGDALIEGVQRRWLSVCHVESEKPIRLVSKTEILENL